MPRGDRQNWGGARTSSRPDAKKGGRPKGFAAVRIPIDDASPLLDFLLEHYNQISRDHPAERGMAFLIAGLQSELAPRE